MAEKYSLKKSEIIKEMFRGSPKEIPVIPKSSKELYPKKPSDRLNNLVEFSKAVGVSAGVTLFLAHCIQTGRREVREEEGKLDAAIEKLAQFRKDYGVAQNIGTIVGVPSSLILQAGGYFYLAINDHLEALLIPVATNVISGVYEAGRDSYLGAKERLIQKKGKELSDKVGCQ